VPVPNDFSSKRKLDDSPELLAKLQQDCEWLAKLHQCCQWADLKLVNGGVITGFFVPRGQAKNIRNDVCSPSTWLRTFLDGLFPRISCAHFGVAITRRKEIITPSTIQIFSFDPLGMFMPKLTSPTLDELSKLKQLGQTTFQQCWCNRATPQKRAKTNPPDNCLANARTVLVPEVDTHWTGCLDMSAHAERIANKAHWQQFAWAALKKVGDFRTVEEAKSVILDLGRIPVNALWRGLDLMEKWQLADVILHLGNGALYWDDDPKTCLQLFNLPKLMLEVLSAYFDRAASSRIALNGTLSSAVMQVYCEFWRNSVSLDSLNQLSCVLNIHSDQIDWHSRVLSFEVMGIGCRVTDQSEIALQWHRHALDILQANKEKHVLEARIRSNLARALFLRTSQDEAFKEACKAKQIIEDYAGERGTHLREETIYHVNTTYLMLNLIRSKGQLPQNLIAELSRAAMAEMEGIYGQDAKLVQKYQQELDNMIESPGFFALVP